MKNTFILLLMTLLNACASVEQTNLKLDLKKVLPYTFELEKRKHKKTPYLAIFKNGEKELYFLASRHLSSVDYPNILKHPTLRSIDKVFSDYKPEVSIVEGINTGNRLSPNSLLNYADKCIKNQYKRCGESFFTINQARASNSHFITGEPTDAIIHKRLLETGYTTEDMLSFYMIRQIPQLIRQGDFSEKTFPGKASDLIKGFKRKIGIQSDFTFKNFKSWYSKNMPTPKSFYDIKNNDAAPHDGIGATYAQKISNKITLIRDQNIVKIISEMLSKFDKVFVVFGGSHLINQKPAFKKVFKEIEYKKLF